MRSLTTFTETPEGLLIELNTLYQEDIDEIRDKYRDEESKYGYLDAWADLTEYPRCNGYPEVPDEYKGLTSAPMFSDSIIDGETTQEDFDNTNIWAFMDYQVRSELDELLDKGFVIFPQVQKAKS